MGKMRGYASAPQEISLIDVYFWPTGNGKRITILLEECGLPYNVIPVNINKGDQLRTASGCSTCAMQI
jgi:hypothetical protein